VTNDSAPSSARNARLGARLGSAWPRPSACPHRHPPRRCRLEKSNMDKSNMHKSNIEKSNMEKPDTGWCRGRGFTRIPTGTRGHGEVL
jgi:hypothetical protein